MATKDIQYLAESGEFLIMWAEDIALRRSRLARVGHILSRLVKAGLMIIAAMATVYALELANQYRTAADLVAGNRHVLSTFRVGERDCMSLALMELHSTAVPERGRR